MLPNEPRIAMSNRMISTTALPSTTSLRPQLGQAFQPSDTGAPHRLQVFPILIILHYSRARTVSRPPSARPPPRHCILTRAKFFILVLWMFYLFFLSFSHIYPLVFLVSFRFHLQNMYIFLGIFRKVLLSHLIY